MTETTSQVPLREPIAPAGERLVTGLLIVPAVKAGATLDHVDKVTVHYENLQFRPLFDESGSRYSRPTRQP